MTAFIVYVSVFQLVIILKFFPIIVGQITCNASCQSHVDAETPSCNLTTGACLYGCKPKFTGHTCEIGCWENCLNCSLLSDNVSTTCHHCEDSFYLKENKSCSPCGSTCLTNISSSFPVCRPTDGRCEFGCKPTYYGASCNIPCSATCKDRDCERDTGRCSSGCALDSLSGDLCIQPCNTGCSRGTCEQIGTCKYGCKTRSWGASCNFTCSLGCLNSTYPNNRSCDETNGTCLYGCIDGLYGSMCGTTCSRNCLGNACWRNGTCNNGCMTQFWGSICDSNCSSNCRNSSGLDNRTCDSNDGTCLFGCTHGHWGSRCELACPQNCAKNNCSDVFGNCTKGCNPGHYGSRCNETCSSYCVDNVCDRDTGVCQCEEGISGTLCIGVQDPAQKESEGEPSVFAPVLLTLAAIIVVIFIVFFSYLVRRE